MTRLTWDLGDREYETGIDQGVFYPQSGSAEPWNGLVSVTEIVSESEIKTRYLDGVKFENRRVIESFSATIEAFTVPESFYDYAMIPRRQTPFGMSYRVKTAHGYKIHLIYNALAMPFGHDYQQKETDPFRWDITTAPMEVPEARLSAHLVIDTAKAHPWTVLDFEDVLYGTDAANARLPLPEEVLEIFESNAILRVTNNGDGTFTVTGPDEAIEMLDPTTFQITWSTAVFIDEVSYKISSL